MSGITRKLAFSIVLVVVMGAAAEQVEIRRLADDHPGVRAQQPFAVTDPDLKRKPFPHKRSKGLRR